MEDGPWSMSAPPVVSDWGAPPTEPLRRCCQTAAVSASLTTVDWIAVGIIVVAALFGFRQGLVVSVLSLAGLLAGAYLGSRALPHLLHNGSKSQWTPLAALAGAMLGAALFQTLAGILGSFVRGGLRLTPLRFADSVG